MNSRYVSLAIVLVLVNYIIFATLFTTLVQTDFTQRHATRTPVPTFTPGPAQPVIVVPTPTPVTPVPSPTPTRVVQSEVGTAADVIPANSRQGTPLQAELTSPGTVNIRSGPTLNAEIIGTLNPNTTMQIVGRTPDAVWWQIRISNELFGWVSNDVVSAVNTKDVPVVAP